jgi:hypothetical protein
MKRFVPRIAAVLFLVVAGALAPAAAGDRPFKVSGAGTFSEYQGLNAHGFEATHLGQAHFHGDVDLDDLSDPGILRIPAYLIAANGDWLYLDCVADYVLDYDTGLGIAIGTATFDGGTGRFQDATGSADVMFDFDPIAHSYSFRFLIDGSINY